LGKRQKPEKREEGRATPKNGNVLNDDFQATLDNLPIMGTIKKLQSSLEILPCYSSQAPSIRLSNETPSSRQVWLVVKMRVRLGVQGFEADREGPL